jgi:Zinc finger, C2H2 type
VCIYTIIVMAAASNRKRSSSLKEYRCSICSKIFDNPETLNSHMSMEHSQKSHAPAGVG